MEDFLEFFKQRDYGCSYCRGRIARSYSLYKCIFIAAAFKMHWHLSGILFFTEFIPCKFSLSKAESVLFIFSQFLRKVLMICASSSYNSTLSELKSVPSSWTRRELLFVWQEMWQNDVTSLKSLLPILHHQIPLQFAKVYNLSQQCVHR